MKKFNLVGTGQLPFRGYMNKQDQTNANPGFLVKGSQNVLSNDGERISVRKGYELYGAANASLNRIEGSYEWTTARGLEVPVRSYDDELEFEYNDTWYRLADGFTAVDFQFAEYWDATEVQDALLFVNGTANIYYWSGGITTFASATSNTITKEGTDTWAEDGFILAGTTQVTIEGTVYTYTGGEATTTLTGVTPDPSAAGHTVGAVSHQTMRTTASKPAASLQNDFIEILDNQVYIGSSISRIIYVSKVNDYTTWTTGTAPGDPVNLTLAGVCKGFVVQEGAMYISAGLNQWYTVVQDLSSDFTAANVSVKRLKTGSQQAALGQGAIANIKNDVIFVSEEPTMDTLGRLENVETPQQRSLSDPIKTDYDGYDFTNTHVKFWRNAIYQTLPNEDLLLIYNVQKGFWEAPQTLPAGRLAIINGDLYLHSNSVPETYKLFTGTNDNASAILATAAFAYRSYGRRDWKKEHDEWYTEGYIASNTTLEHTLKYEFQGVKGNSSFEIDGSNDKILFGETADNSLGANPLGDSPLGGSGEALDGDDITNSKFRNIKTMIPNRYWEIQSIYSSTGLDFQWELIAQGGNIKLAKDDNVEIKDDGN